MKTQLTKKNHGFTIIEVLIVLAIAGLILAIVFLAVPALQRNSRNSQRASDASHLQGLLNEYQANHQGQAPTQFSSDGSAGVGQLDIQNENFAIMTKPANDAAITANYTAPGAPALDTFYVFSNARCSGGTPTTGGGTRAIITTYYTEPGTILQCVGS